MNDDSTDSRWQAFPEFQQIMGQLDMALTENSFEKVTGQLHHYPHDVEKWLYGNDMEKVWYLSDCGYSRVYFSTEHGQLRYTYNSLEKVKTNWEKCGEIIKRAEDYIKKEINRLYRQDGLKEPYK